MRTAESKNRAIRNTALRVVGTTVLSLLAYLGYAVVSASDAVEITSEHRAEIERLMEIINADQMGKQISDMVGQQMVQLLDPKSPDRVARIMEITLEVFNEANLHEEMVNDFVPIYAKYFSLDEVREMIAWHETPLGQKSIELIPQLMAEGMLVSQNKLMAILPEIQEKIAARLKFEGLISEKEEEAVTGMMRPRSQESNE